MDAIRITNLVKKYGAVLAVENLSLTVRAGTMFGFLGPNGSGKSTTIGCMTGLLDATSGKIELLGQPFDADNVAVKRRIGVMPETLGLFEPLYAHEFLAWLLGLGVPDGSPAVFVVQSVQVVLVAAFGGWLGSHTMPVIPPKRSLDGGAR